MYRTYDAEKYIYVKNWLEKDHQAIKVFKNLNIKDLFERSKCTLDLEYCPKYWDYDFNGKRFLVYGLTKPDLKTIIKVLTKHDIECMVTDNMTRKVAMQELKDKVAYKEYNKNNKKKGNKDE